MRVGATFLMIAFAAVSTVAANASSGFEGDIDNQESWKESYFIALDPIRFCMRQPDGVTRIFQRDMTEPHSLCGDSPWVGEIDGDRVMVMTDPQSSGKRIGFLFDKGRLRRMLYGSREIAVRGKAGEIDAKPQGTEWPDINPDVVAAASARYGIYGHWRDRFRLWYKNPNAAGMLLAELALLFLAFLASKHIGFKLLGAAAFLLCAYGIACTESRSAMLGLLFGLVCMFAVHARQMFSRRNVIIAVVLCVVFVAAVVIGGFADRFTTKLFVEGQSSVSRLPIWIKVPKMIVAAPFGWGLGQSGLAYMNWFQPLDRGHVVLGLISTHLTWLAELGWPMRFVYLFAWFAGLSLLFFFALRRKKVLPLAVWVAFFVASSFNTIGVEATLWIIPVALLAAPILDRCWRYRRSFFGAFAIGGVMTVLVVVVLICLGMRTDDDVVVHCEGNGVIVNGKQTSIWVVDDGFVLDGGYYGLLGKGIRDWYSKHRSAPVVGVVKRLDDVPNAAARVVVVGKACGQLLEKRAEFFKGHGNVKKVVFMSPPFGWRDCAGLADELGDNIEVEFITGEFADRVYGGGAGGAKERPEWVNIVSGCALYVPNWLRYVF